MILSMIGGKAYHELMEEALDLEREAAARRAAAEAMRVGARQSGLKAGTEFHHTQGGTVVASCVYEGPRAWRYNGKVYTSCSAAANAAAADLDLRSRSLNGWLFWGIERRTPTKRTSAS